MTAPPGHGVRDPGRRPHPRRGREPDRRTDRGVLADAAAGHVHDVLPRWRRARRARSTSRRRDEVGARGRQAARVDQYRDYLSARPRTASATHALRDAIEAGDVEAAKRLYAVAREPYERVEPVAESFGDLDPPIDARAGDVPPVEVEGFPPDREAALGEQHDEGHGDRSPTGWSRRPRAAAGLVQSVPLQPAQIANGAKSCSTRSPQSKITGEEDRYSHTDLLDFQANVEGAGLRSTRSARSSPRNDPELLRRSSSASPRSTRRSRPTGRGSGFVLYTTLTSRHAQARAVGRRPRRAAARSPAGRCGDAMARMTRRRLLASAGGRGVAAAAGGRIAAAATGGPDDDAADARADASRSTGEHQAGIATPAQDRLLFAAFDSTTAARRRPARADARWTAPPSG